MMMQSRPASNTPVLASVSDHHRTLPGNLLSGGDRIIDHHDRLDLRNGASRGPSHTESR